MFWRAVYCLATWLALPLAFAYFAWRGRREPAYRQYWAERLGLGADMPRDALWVHAASVGEVVLIEPLLSALAERFAQSPLLITTMTPTGRARAEKQFGTRAHIRYMPLDSRGATRRFMRRAAPRIGVLVETELWPNLIAAADRRDVPLVMINASVSSRSAARYCRWPLRDTTRFMLARLTAIGTASEIHAQRFTALGAPTARVHVTGNLKYDTPDNRAVIEAGQTLRTTWQAEARPVWVAASTHAGEEALLLDAFARVRWAHDDVLLVIAPRHPQRFDAVAQLLAASGWTVSRRSAEQAVNAQTDIVLADTLGEVPMFYAGADMVFVGGSAVIGIGGHNVLEPAALGRAICVGPHMQDWREIIDALVECGGALVCGSPTALAEAVAAWCAQPALAITAGEAACRHVEANTGALNRSYALVADILASQQH